ncbi:phospho-sugar mutase [Brevibacillus borstelensis]|uniref:phospho-sugar mutase n=1 Tax=Brevibacillus borstelensis TaxID=45462 RepID=UPI0030BB16B2
MTWKENYRRWLHCDKLDGELRNELDRLKGNQSVLEDCFQTNLEFGTGGIRGILGPGPNRMNLYTVRKVTEGLALYIAEHGNEAMRRGIVIAYDSRYKSADFALEAAKVMGIHGIHSYLFDRLCPTPLLSFAIRHLHAFAGIVITASHNPREYNGYKVYGPDGGQLTPVVTDRVLAKMNEVKDELSVATLDEQALRNRGLLTFVFEDILDAYFSCLEAIRITPPGSVASSSQVKVVFTPLHGTSGEPIMRAMSRFGYDQVTIVQEQAYPDPDFSNAVSLNPEEPQAFERAIEYAERLDADLIFATDPDADRLGVAVKNEQNKYVVLTGNQVGVLLLEYLLSARKEAALLPANGVVLKTIVSSEMARTIARNYGLETIDTLTGFKYIGEKMSEFEHTKEYAVQFGFEESNGYVTGDFVRDKDSIQAAVLFTDMCAFHKSRGKTVYQALLQLFSKYGYYREDLFSMQVEGKKGLDQIRKILRFLRETDVADIDGSKVTKTEDYLNGEARNVNQSAVTRISLPRSDVLKYYLEDGSWFCLRPSGTEPKLKLYCGVKGASLEDSRQKLARLKQSVVDLIGKVHLAE